MSFSDIKGQHTALEIIKQAIKNESFARAYLFTGPEGVGKKLLAEDFIKALNCQAEGLDLRPCGQCPSCLKIKNGQHPDVHFLDDAETGSIKIEDIRALQQSISLRPFEARYKVFLIDNAHNLTAEAANALLKTLEEPPAHSIIILLSAKINLLFKTIISRCQVLKFYSLPRVLLKETLKEDYGVSEAEAHYLTYFSEGRLGIALKLRESGILEEKNKIIDNFICKPDTDNGVKDRQQMRQALSVLASWFRDICWLKNGLEARELINLDRENDLLKFTKKYTQQEIEEIINFIAEAVNLVEQNINVKLLSANLACQIKR